MATLGYFIIGIVALFLFFVIGRPLIMFVPGFGLKAFTVIGLGLGCTFFFMWLVPECTTAGNREAIESDLGGLYESVVELGKSTIDPELDNYRFNKWLNKQRKNKESGYYQGVNALQYYNAEEDRDYYQLPNGKWQDRKLWNTPVDFPFEIPAWKEVNSVKELEGIWMGTNTLAIPANEESGIAESSILVSITMEIDRRGSVNIGFKLDMNNSLDNIAAHPEFNRDKDQLWSEFTESYKPEMENSDISISYGKYYYQIKMAGFSLEDSIQAQSVLISNTGTEKKILFPGSIFGDPVLDDIECILEKQ
jgi:hypothetical protein